MSSGNLELVRRLVAVFNEDGVATAIALHFAPDAVFEEPPDQPGAQVAEGRDEAGQAFSRFDEAWERHRSEIQELRVVDDERVLMLSVERLRGRDGIEFAQPAGTLFTQRDGKVVRMQAFWDQRRALEAAGLRE